MELTREQLYEMMWSDGVCKTGEALGLKPYELQAICDEFNIPKPSSNYWIAFKLDKSPEKTPLSATKKEGPIRTEDYLKRKTVKKEKPAIPIPPGQTEGRYPPRELPPEEPATIYSVPEKLYAKDPLILDTKAKLRELNSRQNNPWSNKNPYKSTPQKWLDISVYQSQEDRALRIFHTIWRAAEAKGYPLFIKVNKGPYNTRCETYFIVRQHYIRVQLKEINRRVKNESSTWTSWTWAESGRLKFLCDKESENHRYSYYNNERVAAQDTERSRIEDKIERIIEVLGEIADRRDQAEVERKLAEERRLQEEELKRQEQERKRLEEEEKARIEERRDEERSLVRQLLFDADRAKTAEIIRSYAARFETAMRESMPAEELQRQLQWMREKADFIDPFINRSDEWLLPSDIERLINPEITKTSEQTHTSYGGYGNHTETAYSYWQIKNMWGHR